MNKLGFKPLPAEIREYESQTKNQEDRVAMAAYAQR